LIYLIFSYFLCELYYYDKFYILLSFDGIYKCYCVNANKFTYLHALVDFILIVGLGRMKAKHRGHKQLKWRKSDQVEFICLLMLKLVASLERRNKKKVVIGKI